MRMVRMMPWSPTRRAPYGARGLKWRDVGAGQGRIPGRAPYGARGLKFSATGSSLPGQGRAPYGARGLKLFRWLLAQHNASRAPVWGRGFKNPGKWANSGLIN